MNNGDYKHLYAYQATIWATQPNLKAPQLAQALTAQQAQLTAAHSLERSMSFTQALQTTRHHTTDADGLALPEHSFVQSRISQQRPGTLVVENGKLYLDLGTSVSRLELCAFQDVNTPQATPRIVETNGAPGKGVRGITLSEAALAFLKSCNGEWGVPPMYAVPLAALDESSPLCALLRFEYPEADCHLQISENVVVPAFFIDSIHVSLNHTELLLDNEVD